MSRQRIRLDLIGIEGVFENKTVAPAATRSRIQESDPAAEAEILVDTHRAAGKLRSA